MSEKTHIWANAMLNHLTGQSQASAVTPTLRLWTSKPNVDGTGGTEVAGGGYAAQSLSGLFAAPSEGSCTNSSAITFPTAGASWGTVIAMSIYDATLGQLALIDVPLGGKLISEGDTFSIPAGALVLGES